MVNYIKLLLWPFSVIYGAVTTVRNQLFDKGALKSTRFSLPVISIGNLTVGGTGKTPHVAYLVQLLHHYQVAVLSRGYKRKTKGFILADATATAATIGDEPYQYVLDFPDATVAVCEKRAEGIAKLQQLKPGVQAVVLDDAMQHRAVQPSLNVMLTDYGRPFFRDFILPAGLLREARSGAARADVIVVSKCPAALSEAQMQNYEQEIRKYSQPQTPIFFSTFKYGAPVGFGASESITRQIVLLTGIANPEPLKEYLQQQGYTVVASLAFPDHHTYSAQDLHKVKQEIERHKSLNPSIITTSKDAVKLTDSTLANATKQLPIFYMPIQVEFLQNGDLFNGIVLTHVSEQMQRYV